NRLAGTVQTAGPAGELPRREGCFHDVPPLLPGIGDSADGPLGPNASTGTPFWRRPKVTDPAGPAVRLGWQAGLAGWAGRLGWRRQSAEDGAEDAVLAALPDGPDLGETGRTQGID